METATLISIEDLYTYLHDNYSYNNGGLYRLKSKTRWKKGHRIGTIGKRGYETHYLFGKRWYIHQLIYLYHHKILPVLIDHRDTNKINNHIDNLREGNKILNGINMDNPHKDNQLGVLGVIKRKDTGKFLAQFQGKRLGEFKTLEEAKYCYDSAKAIKRV